MRHLPVNVLPLDKVWFSDVMLQRADGTVGVLSFEGWLEVRL